MIFAIHYLLFHAGSTSAVCLMSVFLKHYAHETSISEIGFLLMFLPFIWTFAKPICCAMADRYRAHKKYFMVLLLIISISYALITVPTFFEGFMENNARLVWYYFAFWITVGYTCYGAIFSLADALSVNAAIKRKIHWGYYRSCLVISWGLGGCLIGMINENPLLPRYTSGYLVIFGTCLIEFFLVGLWTKKDFEFEEEIQMPEIVHKHETLRNDFDDSMSRGSTAHLSPRMVLSIANIVVGEVGSTIRSSIKSSNRNRRPCLADLVGADLLTDSPNEKPLKNTLSIDGNESSRNRTQSVSANDRSIAKLNNYFGSVQKMPSSLKNMSLDVAPVSNVNSTDKKITDLEAQQHVAGEEKIISENLQILLLKIIFKRDPIAIRYFLLFIVLGALMNIHLTYFMMHAEEVSHHLGYQFSKVAGTYFFIHACSEVFSFIFIAQYYMPYVGRLMSIVTVAIACAIRYGFYATYYPLYSPYWAILTETVHGIGFGIVNTLVCDMGRETVDQVDKFLPELIKLGIVDPKINPIELKLLLRATMQGVFGGALDGLGNGIGVLAAGLYLEHHGFIDLWAWCCYVSVGLLIVYPLTEIRKLWHTQETS